MSLADGIFLYSLQLNVHILLKYVDVCVDICVHVIKLCVCGGGLFTKMCKAVVYHFAQLCTLHAASPL